MKTKCIFFALISVLGLSMVSCGNDDEPITPPRYRISWIYSDNSIQLFDYDSSGRISEWKYDDLSQNPSDVYSALYKYLEDGDVIEIKAKEKRGSDTWNFNEQLCLNPNGTASYAAGTVTILNGDNSLLMKKNYSVKFHYDSSRQLTNIDVVEKRINDYGWEEESGLEWFVELEWDEHNLTKYTEYSNRDNPFLSRSFTYYGGETVHYAPIVQGPILRNYYLPLQKQGIFGPQSVGLVKDKEVSSNSSNYTTSYSYDISASVYSSMVDEYTELINGKETKYTMGWDTDHRK